VRVFAADWSGARTGEERHLVLAEVDVDTRRVLRLVPATRDGVTVALLDAAAHGDVLAGLDFAFSLPRWWLDTQRIASVDDLWADTGRLEGWLAACEPPFWGRPGRRRPGHPVTSEYRVTELAASPRPRSTFQIGGAGAVGTATLRGLPHLHRLRRSGFGVWPWDPWAAPAVVEAWPRLALGPVVKSSVAARRAWVDAHVDALDDRAADFVVASDDALDAAATGLRLAATWAEARPRPAHPAVALEGWIAGVVAPSGGGW
jgi:hypothetical protein